MKDKRKAREVRTHTTAHGTTVVDLDDLFEHPGAREQMEEFNKLRVVIEAMRAKGIAFPSVPEGGGVIVK